MRKWLIGAILVVIAYVGYPYLTLYWIDHALLNDDKGALERLVDWPLVRQQLKADVELALIEFGSDPGGKGQFRRPVWRGADRPPRPHPCRQRR